MFGTEEIREIHSGKIQWDNGLASGLGMLIGM